MGSRSGMGVGLGFALFVSTLAGCGDLPSMQPEGAEWPQVVGVTWEDQDQSRGRWLPVRSP